MDNGHLKSLHSNYSHTTGTNYSETLFPFGITCSMTPGGGGGVLAMSIYEGVRVKSQIQTQKYGFTVNFVPKNIVILHIFYPKICVTISF